MKTLNFPCSLFPENDLLWLSIEDSQQLWPALHFKASLIFQMQARNSVATFSSVLLWLPWIRGRECLAGLVYCFVFFLHMPKYTWFGCWQKHYMAQCWIELNVLLSNGANKKMGKITDLIFMNFVLSFPRWKKEFYFHLKLYFRICPFHKIPCLRLLVNS